RANGGLYLRQVPQGRLKVTGHISWSKENDAQLRKASIVRVFVNGFQQLPALLDDAKGKERQRAFSADLVLNRSEGNFVEIDLHDIKQEASNHCEFTVACAKPVKGQRLHMLIVGVGEKDEEKLKGQAIKALRADTANKDRVKTPAFEDVRFYGPLAGYVKPE